MARLEIKKNDERVVLVRDKRGNWNMGAPREGKVNRKAVNDYLATLLQLRAEEFSYQETPDLKKYRLQDPVLVISFEGDSSRKIETLLVSENENFFLMRDDHPTFYTIDPISYIAIHKTASDFLAS